ncbi:uncharacterized protein LOC143300975 isoform X1 [Babylonia areolata]|uniref:uncharacterized protein LOC143300975 isoform X1 n=1 Tax=Babylonia areolata TaxID=304850 RepID=UPI003FD5E040
MKTLMLLFLAVSVVLVVRTEARWRFKKKVIRFPRTWYRRYFRSTTLGKRSADEVDALLNVHKRSQDDSIAAMVNDAMQANEAMDLLNKLSLRCPGFGTDTKVGLNKALVTDAFDAVDKDNDNQLDEKELDKFQDVVDAFEDCEQSNAHKAG